jgi:hypothetical protein
VTEDEPVTVEASSTNPSGSDSSRRSAPTIAVCAMGKRPFTAIAQRWIADLGRAGSTVRDHRAVVSPREDVVDDLNGGADVVIYLGHGRTRGWNGYQTIRQNHLDARPSIRPVSAVLAFACSTLERDDGTSFGASLVASGRASSYLGWPSPLPLDEGLAVADLFVDSLMRGAPTIGELLATVQRCELRQSERDVVAECRIIGDASAALI